jgi:hypothetical protein
MNDQERQIIDDMFARLRQVESQPRDPEAERHISERVRAQPYAPYAMAQAIVVQEQALANLNAEVERLRAELERAQRQPQQQGGLLASIFGGNSRSSEPTRPQGGSPWGRQSGPVPGSYGSGMPQQQMPGGGFGGGGFGGGGGPWGQRAGGGFLQSAMTTAAGVAGGMMIANALSSAFGGDHGAGDKQGLAGDHSAGADAQAAGGSADAAGSDGGTGSFGGITDSLYQDASHNDPSADFGGDSGDDGDWT